MSIRDLIQELLLTSALDDKVYIKDCNNQAYLILNIEKDDDTVFILTADYAAIKIKDN